MSEPAVALPLTTMLYDPKDGGFYLVNRHHKRLQLAIPALFPGLGPTLALEKFNEAIWKQVCVLGYDVRQRVRVTVDRNLRCHVTSTPLPKAAIRPLPLRLDELPTPVSAFSSHKSTARDIYEDARSRVNANYSSPDGPEGCPFDVLMWNERGEVTETSIANFAVHLRGSDLLSAVPEWRGTSQELEEGTFVTPGLEMGLIAGVMRAELLETGIIVEGNIKKKDIHRYGQNSDLYPMVCFNAVRGMYDVYVMEGAPTANQPAHRTKAVDSKHHGSPFHSRNASLPALVISPTLQSSQTTPDTTPGLTPTSLRPSSASSFYKDNLNSDTILKTLSPLAGSPSCSPFIWRRGVIIDCYDSYTNNLLQLFDQDQSLSDGSATNFDAELAAHVTVLRADQISWPDFRTRILPNLDFVILSPGPGSPHVPADIGVGGDLLLAMTSGSPEIQPVPTLGVCLGHQALAALLGGKVIPAKELVHGRTITIQHNGTGLFEALDPRQYLRMVRYNSLTVDATVLPHDLEIIATNPDDNEIMGLQHSTLPLYSVQFHPESICSRRSHSDFDAGKQILRNFMSMVDKFWVANGRPERLPLPEDIQQLGVLNLTELDTPNLKHPSVGHQAKQASFEHSYRVERRDIGPFIPRFAQTRPDLIFEATSYSSNHPFFWLDSAAAAPGDEFARFSYMGPASPDRCISYDLTNHCVSCGTGTHIQLKKDDSFWHWMDRMQCDLSSHVNTGDVVEGFKCGFIGYFGYEMKTGALPGYHSPSTDGDTSARPPDAQFMFADRVVAYDHWSKKWSAMGLVRDEHPNFSPALLEKETTTRIGLQSPEFDDWVDSIQQNLNGLRNTEDTVPSSSNIDPLPHSFTYNSTPEAYKSAINACKSRIAEGNSYELCLTGQYHATAPAASLEYFTVYKHFRVQNPASHAAFVSFPETQTTIMSCSPELFIRFDGTNGRQAVMKPIKGTLKRSKCRCGGLCKLPACGARKAECDTARHKQDEQRIKAFVSDPKETAENLMIADLIRANLLEFCSPSSVDVTKLFALETYENVYSLVSTITGNLLPSIGTVEGIRRCFPPGSMTGAPKLRSVQLLDSLETSRRGIYSGCLGYLSLDNRSVFSVVIRTLIAYKDQLSYGAGGAITWLSDVDGEWDEVVLKARSVLKDRVSRSG